MVNIMKKVISIVMAAVMVMGLAACSSSNSAPSAPAAQSTPAEAQTQAPEAQAPAAEAPAPAADASSDEKELKIAFFMFENSNTFTTYIRKGMEFYGKEKNVVVDSFDGKSDQSTQTDSVTTVLAKGGYDMIVALDISGDNYWLVQGDDIRRDFTDNDCSNYAYDYMEDYFVRGMYDDAVLELTAALEDWYGGYYR